METVKVGDTGCHNRHRKARRLCYCPCCHETAVAATGNSNAIAIDHTALDQVVDATEQILEILAAHIAHDRIGEGYPTSPASAYIGAQHSITGGGQFLGAKVCIAKIISPGE